MTGGRIPDLTDTLRAGARGQHDDLSVMDEAAGAIEFLQSVITGFAEQAGDWKKTSRESYLAWKESQKEIERLRAENARLRCVMTKAHAVMRQTGWQLALSCEDPPGGDLLALAAAEVESEFASVLGAKEGQK